MRKTKEWYKSLDRKRNNKMSLVRNASEPELIPHGGGEMHAHTHTHTHTHSLTCHCIRFFLFYTSLLHTNNKLSLRTTSVQLQSTSMHAHTHTHMHAHTHTHTHSFCFFKHLTVSMEKKLVAWSNHLTVLPTDATIPVSITRSIQQPWVD